MKGKSWKTVIARFMTMFLLICLILDVWPSKALAETNAQAKETIPSDVAQFPESYHAGLLALKELHPNWSFVRVDVMDWNTAIKYEMSGGKSLIENTFPEYMWEGAYDQGHWYFASKAILQYYMDPRNSLTESTIFQFEQLDFNGDYQTEAAVAKFLSGTFMGDGAKVPNTVLTFPTLIYACGKHDTVRVSPFHLAARIRQEQGRGKSALISGTYPGYEGYYNYFNFGATGTTNADVIRNGLEYAKETWGKDLEINGVIDHNQGAYNAIFVGSQILASNYVKRGQDTLYLQKYDVNSSAPCTHQYMQNITAPTTEGASIRTQYGNAGVLNSSFVFLIPVYKNMPEQACPKPTYSTNIVLEISSDSTDPYNYTQNYVTVDGVQYEGESYYNSKKNTRRLIVTLPDGNAKHAWIELKNASGTIVRGYYWDLTYYGTYYKATVGTKPTPKTCTVSFDASGGSGTMASVQVEQWTKLTLPECGFQPAMGHEFEKWDIGKPGDEITVTDDLTITACWKKLPCEIKVNLLPAEGGIVEGLTNGVLQALGGDEVRLKAIPNEGYVFQSWMEGETIVSNEAEYVFTAGGDRTLTAVFEEAEVEGTIIHSALAAMEGKIGMVFYLSFPEELIADPGAYVILTMNGNEQKHFISKMTPEQRDGILQYRFARYIVAKEYRDVINLKVYDGEGHVMPLHGVSGTDFTETGVEYSLKDYVSEIKGYSDEKTRALGQAIEDYCTAAQVLFQYHAEGLSVSDELAAIGEEQLSAFAPVVDGELPKGVTGRNMTVSFEADNSLKIFFTYADNVDPYSYQYFIDGKEATLQTEEGKYFLKTSGIVAKNLDQTNVYVISDGTDTCTMTCSALTYALVAYQEGEKKQDNNWQNLCRGIYAYNVAAKAYFAK